MKKTLSILSLTLLLCNCSKAIDSKILLGTWWISTGNGNSELSFNKDSIFIENGYGFLCSGKYYVKSDSVFMNIGNTISKVKIKYNKKDSLLTFNDSKYWKRYDSVNTRTTKKFNFINVKSKDTIRLNDFRGINYFIKIIKNENDRLKVVLNDRITGIDEIPSFLVNCNNGEQNYYPKINFFISKNVSLLNLKEIYPILHAYNHKSVRLISYYDFSHRTFHYYKPDIHVFREDLSKMQPPPPPPASDDFYRKDFIKKFNPKLLSIKSKKDFNKLEKIIPNTQYLISIDINTPIKDYLYLIQKLNSIKKAKKVKIRTEII